MKHLMLSATAIVVAFGLGACERETKTVEKGGTTVVQPMTKEKETVVLPTPGKETVKEKETVVRDDHGNQQGNEEGVAKLQQLRSLAFRGIAAAAP